ncbi:MAG: hypothetical protein ACYDBQ_00935 [Thermoplasmatota archaeon]
MHLYHGLVSVYDNVTKRPVPINVRAQVRTVRSRAGKNLRQIWPAYLKALWRTRARPGAYIRFVFDVSRQVRGVSYTGRAAADSSTDACCVFTQADVTHAVRRYHMSPDAVHVVGNPDLPSFGLQDDDLGCCLQPGRDVANQVVYVDTAMIETAAVFNDAEEFVAHLVSTRDALKSQGLGFMVKLHPAHERTRIPAMVDWAGLVRCSKSDFVRELRRSRAAIVEVTTAAMVPALMGLPLLLAGYGKLGPQAFGPALTSYPRSSSLVDTHHAMQEIERLEAVDPEVTAHWIEQNTGPLPSAAMADRVAAALAGMLAAVRDRARTRIPPHLDE